MKPTIVLSILACLLLVTPAVAAGSDGPEFAVAPCPDGILAMGVVPYTLCMAAWGADVASSLVVTACEIIFGPGNC